MFPERGETDPWQGEYEEEFSEHAASLLANPPSVNSPDVAMPAYYAPNNFYGLAMHPLSGMPASQYIAGLRQQPHSNHLQSAVTHLHGHPAPPIATPNGGHLGVQTRDTGGLPTITSISNMTPQPVLSDQPMSASQRSRLMTQHPASSSISKYEGSGSYPMPVEQQKRSIKRTMENTEVDESTSRSNINMSLTLSPFQTGAQAAPEPGQATNDVAQHLESGSDQPTSLAKSKITLTDLKSNTGVLSLGADDFGLRFDSADAASAVAYPRIKLNLEEDDVDHVESHPEEYIRSIIRAINYNGYLEPQALDKNEGLSDAFVKAWKKWQLSSHDKVQKILRGDDKKYHILERRNIQEEVEALARMMVQAFIDASKIGCRRTIFGEDVKSKCTERLESATIMLASYSIMRLDFLKGMKFDHFAANPEKFTATKTQSMKSNWKRWVSKNGDGTQGQDAQDQDKAATEAQVEANVEVEADNTNNASVDEDEAPPKKRRKSSNKSKQPESRASVPKKKKSSTLGE